MIGEKDHDLAPELVAYALTRSFNHASHRSGHDSLSRSRCGHRRGKMLRPLSVAHVAVTPR